MNSRTMPSSRMSGRGSSGRPRGRFGLLRRAGSALGRLVARRPLTALGSLAVLSCGSVLCWNLLMGQTSRHPAPLFAGPKPQSVAAAPVEPPRRPETFAAPAPPAMPRAEPASFTGRVAAEAPTRPVSSQDPIGALIRTSDPAQRPGDPKAAQPKLASAQKALAKLGYGPIVVDGVMGATTRQAIERFERDRKLPVTGTLGTRTVKQLASASGLQVE